MSNRPSMETLPPKLYSIRNTATSDSSTDVDLEQLSRFSLEACGGGLNEDQTAQAITLLNKCIALQPDAELNHKQFTITRTQ